MRASARSCDGAATVKPALRRDSDKSGGDVSGGVADSETSVMFGTGLTETCADLGAKSTSSTRDRSPARSGGVADLIRRVVDQAPPLSPGQRGDLAVLLRPSDDPESGTLRQSVVA